MQNEEHNKKTINLFYNGVDSDNMPEAIQEGFFVDAKNMRVDDTNKRTGKALSKIAGEQVIYTSGIYTGTWKCIGADTVNDNIVEFWCNVNNSYLIIKVDGIVVCYTDKSGLTYNHPLQIDTNDSCVGGEIFITDFNVHPYIFNIQDLLDHVGDMTYFSEFNPNNYTIQLPTNVDHPVFVSLDLLGGVSGVLRGEYSYAIRYADATGNKTNWSVCTPYIPVPINISSLSEQYVGVKTYGGIPDTTTPTKYGVRIRFRVNNIAGYEYIEIKRIAQNTGQALNYMPTSYKTTVLINYYNSFGNNVDILANPIDIIDFIDKDSVEWEEISDQEELTETQSAFDVAKSIRYYAQRLVLMNIKYPSKDLTLTEDIIINPTDAGFPIMEKMGKLGHNDIYNQVYFKHLQSGERYGWGVQCYDATGSRTFVLPILPNYLMPNRREQMLGDSALYSDNYWKGAVTAATIYSNDANDGRRLGKTFEVFDLEDAVAKNNNDEKNILNDSGTGYNPFHPVNDNDSNISGHNYYINDLIFDIDGNAIGYKPEAFSPNYYSMGMAFYGIDTTKLPSFVKAFSIVRTKSANRVIAQGIGIYKFNGGNSKEKGKLWCYFPDLDINIGLQTKTVEQLKNYQIQLVSPLGYFTELYDGEFGDATNNRNIDLINYARIIREKYDKNDVDILNKTPINPTYWKEKVGIPDNNGYVSFGKFLNQDYQADIFNTSYDITKYKFSISDILEVNGGTSGYDGRMYYYEIELGDGVYKQSEIGGFEPFYIINIINEGAEVPITNSTEYIETGHLQKLESIIGKGNGNNQTIPLVDERWEDCIPNYYYPDPSMQNRFVYVDNKRWVNVTYKDPTEINNILNGLQANGEYVLGTGETIYGVYKNNNSTFINTENKGLQFSLIFSQFSTLTEVKYFVPQSGYIIVKYDNTIPIKVFAGDSVVGESVFSPLDRQSDNESNSVNTLPFYTSIPYFEYNINSGVIIPKRSFGGDDVQNRHDIQIGMIRQLLCMFTCESKVNVPFMFGDNFANVHYVMRPHRWKPTKSDNDKIYSNYWNDYPYEDNDVTGEYVNNWKWGGFRFPGSTNNKICNNIDYSHQLNVNNNISKPLVGFTEKTWFCTRAIWSEKRSTNEQNDPNLKTFPVNNIFDILDSTQEIKYAYDNLSNKGNNLFAITGKGICLLLTEKTILSDLNVNEIAVFNPETGFIKGEYWLTKKIGCNDELWRGIAEYDNKIFIPNNKSIYKMDGIEISDVGRKCKGGYYSNIYSLLSRILSGYSTPLTAVYDVKHEEYWISAGIEKRSIAARKDGIFDFSNPENYYHNPIDSGEYIKLNINYTGSNGLVYLPTTWIDGQYLILENTSDIKTILVYNELVLIYTLQPNEIKTFTKDDSQQGYSVTDYFSEANTLVFSDNELRQAWFGSFDYNFDKLVSVEKIGDDNNFTVVGMRDLETYELNVGNNINLIPINAYVVLALTPQKGLSTELINVIINSDDKPIRIEFAESFDALPECYLDANISTLYLKNYRGTWYNQVPRKTELPKDRLQNDKFYIKIIHNEDGSFVLKEVISGYKLLK